MKVRLLDIAHARSGDKGDTANVGVIALEPEWYPVLVQLLTLERVAQHFRGVITGAGRALRAAQSQALNFLLHGALDGGGTLSLKTDAQGKVFSTAMLRMVLDVPDDEAKAPGFPALTDRGRRVQRVRRTDWRVRRRGAGSPPWTEIACSTTEIARLLVVGLVVCGYGQRMRRRSVARRSECVLFRGSDRAAFPQRSAIRD